MPKGRGSFVILHARRKILVDFLPWKGMHVRSCHERRTVTLDRFNATVHWEWPDMKKKSNKGGGDEAAHLAPVETEYFGQLMALVEHCACRKYEDGDSRETGWFTVKTVGAAWQVQVKDPDSGMSFTATGGTLDKALETAVLLLACDEAPWETDKWLKGRKAQKKEK